jgi:anti-sigma factor RsiW
MTTIWKRIRGSQPRGLTCIELVELVTDYLEGNLGEDDRARVERHLAGCDACTAYIDQMRITIAVVGRVEVDDLSEAAKAELLHAFRDWAHS